jgi:DNA-binding CsgD family transcriptional regulator
MSLTPRERQVLDLVASGMLNKQIAAQLGAAEKTIKVHRSRIMEKMQVRTAAALVALLSRLDAPLPPPAPVSHREERSAVLPPGAAHVGTGPAQPEPHAN